MIGIMFVIFVICMVLAIPVGFSIAISATAFLVLDSGIPIYSVVQKLIDGINSFSYLALPLFVLSGAIMIYGATPRLMRFANMLLGRLPGGLVPQGAWAAASLELSPAPAWPQQPLSAPLWGLRW